MNLKPPIKVLHIITRMISGGADENTYQTVLGLDEKKYQVEVACGPDSELKRFPSLEQYRVYKIPSLKREINPIFDIKALIDLYLLIRREKYQIVHTHTAKAGILGRIAAKCAKVPVVLHGLHGVTFHDYMNPIQRWMIIQLERVAGTMTDKFISVGRDIAELYKRHNVGSPDKYALIRSGFDLQKIRRISTLSEAQKIEKAKEIRIDPKLPVIISASRLEKRKGQIYLLLALKKLKEKTSNFHCIIFGEGIERMRLEEFTAKNGLSQHVTFAGYHKDILMYFPLARVFVLTSLWEGLPRVVVEAAAAGLPSIVFQVEGVNEVVQSGETGFIVPKTDVDELSKKIEELALDCDRARSMGGKAKTRIDDTWDVRYTIKEMNQLYDDMSRQKLNY